MRPLQKNCRVGRRSADQCARSEWPGIPGDRLSSSSILIRLFAWPRDDNAAASGVVRDLRRRFDRGVAWRDKARAGGLTRYPCAEMAEGRDRRMRGASRQFARKRASIICPPRADWAQRYDRSRRATMWRTSLSWSAKLILANLLARTIATGERFAAPIPQLASDHAIPNSAISRRARMYFPPDILPRNAACRSVPRTRCIFWDR